MSLAKLPMLFECVKCGKRFNKNSAFQSHMDTHSDKVHECDQCEKKYKRLGDLREHKQTAHAEAGRFVCDECGKICPHKKASRHMETHTGQSCECDVCGTIHRNASALALHKLRAHSEAKHPCEHCGKVFRVASDLRKHVDTHGEKREEHPCARCPRTFKSLRNRDNHMRMEHSDSRFTCEPECDLHSATRSEYRGHLNRRHAKQHPASCKCVSVDVMVAQHVATKLGNTTLVTADGSMKCTDSDCDFATTCARRMESHKDERDHDVYQPVLRCIRCEIWFTSPSHLKSHNTATHEGERRFKCDRCGYFTNQKGVFVKHQRSCDQGKARGNLRLKRTEPTTEHLDVKKESPHGVYQFESKLGQGGFGKVYEAVKKGEDPSVKYAIKEVGPNGGKSAEIEAKCMRRFEHKNVMSLLEYYEWKEQGRLTRFIVMECCRPGSLTIMQKLVQFQFEEPHVLYVLKEVTCGLEHLHSAGVIHRDLKSANVLVNERAEVKIADFGVSTDERVAFNCRGTHGWEAPEVVAAALTGITGLRSAYTQKADVYSVGVLAIDCFLPRETLPTDFFHKTKVESEFFAETQLQRIEEDRRLQLSDAFKTLVSHCVKPVQKRLSAAAVQKIPAVKKASVEPFKLVVAECLKKQKGKEDKRSARRQEPAIDTDTSSLPSSPKHRSGLATASTAEHQPSTSAGTSDLSSAAPARTRNGHSTANTTAVTNIFPSSEHRSQQASTSGGMPSLFFSTASALDY